MSQSIQSATPVAPNDAIAGALAPLDSILRTEELFKRPERPPDYETETSALTALVQALADAPQSILQTLADKVLSVLGADSAGLSLVTRDGKRFYWAAIAGAWGPHVGGGTPRNFGPCGDVLDRNVPMLFTHWEQRYPYLSAAVPLAEEGLLVPFHVGGKAVGTIWGIAHNTRRKFDAEDLRLLESLGRFASAAYQTVQFVDDLKTQVAAREQAEVGLRELTDTLAAQVRERTEELRRSQAFLSEAQRVSRTGSFSWRVVTDEITWSDELYRIFEFDPAIPVTPAMIRSRLDADAAASLLEFIHRAKAAAIDFEGEHRLHMPDGSVKYVNVIARATVNAVGGLEYVGTVRDVTERHQTEEALAKARAELARASSLATLAELSAAIAHEVNQPLSAIVNNASACLRWLSAEPPNLQRAQLTAQRIVEDGNWAAEVVGRVRALFKHSAPNCVVLNINDVVADVRQLMLNEFNEGDIAVETDLDSDLPQAVADRVQLQQVMTNLLRNGIEAMRMTDVPRLLTIRSRREGSDHVRIDVCDRGTGIENENEVFKPFFTTKGSGMGMGLAICRSIIEAHRGRLWVGQSEGPGAIFSFTLPTRAGELP
jgi:C4-dicarboxylate-specific signal transduction histidine kinase